MTTAQPLPRGEIVQQMDGTYELFPVPTDQDTLYGILTDCLAEWERIRIGLLIPGAVWEIKPPRPPRTGFLDGYLTVDFRGVAPAPVHRRAHVGPARGRPPAPHRPRRALPPPQPRPPAHVLGLPPLQRRRPAADHRPPPQPPPGRTPTIRKAAQLVPPLPVGPATGEIPGPGRGCDG